MQLIVNDELKLQTLQQSEAADYFGLIQANQAQLAKWLPWALKVETLADQERTIRAAVKADQNQPTQFSIYWRHQLVGRISFVELDLRKQTAEIGYWLSEDAQGNGIMCASVDRLVQYGFEILRLRQIDLKIAVQNKASLHVAAACGFKQQERLTNAIHLIYGPVDAVRWTRFNKITN
ncbi:MAG TPA: hypothetical protein DCW31_07250 [Lactobacillus sp.]|nr:hypothetical protein [Lactobacillus sp.]